MCSKIVLEVCQAIVAQLGYVISCPNTEAQWMAIADRFTDRWNLHHCLGAIDGKHIRIRKPAGASSEYFNHKFFHSIILLAVADADYKFRFVETGYCGRNSDAGLFRESDLFRALDEGKYSIIITHVTYKYENLIHKYTFSC